MSKGRRQEFPRHEVVSGLREGDGAELSAQRRERSRVVCLNLQVGPAFPRLQCAMDLATNQLGKERLQRRGIGCLVTTG